LASLSSIRVEKVNSVAHNISTHSLPISFRVFLSGVVSRRKRNLSHFHWDRGWILNYNICWLREVIVIDWAINESAVVSVADLEEAILFKLKSLKSFGQNVRNRFST
jgi:hypothetical protein